MKKTILLAALDVCSLEYDGTRRENFKRGLYSLL